MAEKDDTTPRSTFKYYRKDLAEGLHTDGRPTVGGTDELLVALVREHGAGGRPDIAEEIAAAQAIAAARRRP
jgi:hypothetical protein